MNNKQELTQGCLGCLGLIVMQVACMVMAGVAIQYAWNNLIVNIFEVNSLALWQAISIDVLLTYILGYSSQQKERELGNIMVEAVIRAVFLMTTTAVLMQFT